MKNMQPDQGSNPGPFTYMANSTNQLSYSDCLHIIHLEYLYQAFNTLYSPFFPEILAESAAEIMGMHMVQFSSLVPTVTGIMQNTQPGQG